MEIADQLVGYVVLRLAQISRRTPAASWYARVRIRRQLRALSLRLPIAEGGE